ncbi:B12-binding domain-containing radical SAM protein [Clostridium neuense]|uniref:B12-binding domain-containing radical SAM protein n=1 Tax=Clostridium neuense TaxID=1728934 RepID=A0ABW8TDK5_9CLOT
MKVAFVNSFDLGENSVPLGILSLATVMSKVGHEIKVFDFDYYADINKEKTNSVEQLKQFAYLIMKFNPRVICFYTMCNSYHKTLLLAKCIKDISSDTKVILGGPQATLTAKETLKSFEYVDAIGIGEGENNIDKIVNAVINNSYDEVKGIAYRKDGLICINNNELIENLDELPMIDYSFVNIKNINHMPLDVGRGCPYSCVYCSSKTFWKRKFRIKSNERIIFEIKNIMQKYGINKFDFVHDLFTANRNKLIQFCNYLINEELNINWSCSARLDTLDEEVITIMKKAGCSAIYLGIESGSQKIQKEINKNLDLTKMWYIMKIIKSNNIKTTLSFIYGFPQETLDDIRETMEMIRIATENELGIIQLHKLSILPETELFYLYKDKMIRDKEFSDISSSMDLELYEDIISNINLFPQYYKVYIPHMEHLAHLDYFVFKILNIIYRHFNTTYKILLEEFEMDLLEIFMYFEKYNSKELSLHRKMDSQNEKEGLIYIIRMISTFINKHTFKRDLLVKELFKFDYDILCFRLDKNINKCIKKYKVDINSARNNLESYNKEEHKMYMLEKYGKYKIHLRTV